MLQDTRTRPATAADFHRLADVAHERGLEVIQDAQGRHFVTSHSTPFALHAVTGFSCDCKGFVSHGRCSHHALLLQSLGWLPELEPEMPFVDPVSQVSAACPSCGSPHRADGHHTYDIAADVWICRKAETSPDCRDCCGCGVQDYGQYALPCETCGGSGRVPVVPGRRLVPVTEPARVAA